MQGTAESIEEFVASSLVGFVHCRREAVIPGALLADLGVDSLGVATLVTFVEAEYGCSFTPAQLMQLYSALRIDELLRVIGQVVSGAADVSTISATPAATV